MTNSQRRSRPQRNRRVDDVRGPDLRLLFVGVNPGLRSAAVRAHFAHPSNRFYAVLHHAGITAYRIDATSGYRKEDLRHLLARRIGITNLVSRTTTRADQLDRMELKTGATILNEKVAIWKPRVVAVLGVVAYRVAFGRPHARSGWQPERLMGAELVVLGNPSGKNAHETVDSLAAGFRAAAFRAGIQPFD